MPTQDATPRRPGWQRIPWAGGLLIVAAALCVTGPSLAGRSVMVPWDILPTYLPWRAPTAPAASAHNGLIADLVFQAMPWQQVARESGGRWNPHILCGQPLAHGLLHGYLYPPGVLWRILSPETAAAWLFAFHLIAGGIGCLLLARRTGCGPHGSTLAGLVYAFGGPAFANMTFMAMQGAIAWLPVSLLAVRGLWDSWERGTARRLAWSALLSAACALSMLSGHPEVTLYGLIMAGAYATWLLLGDRRPGRHARRLGMAAAFGAAAGVATLAVAPELPGLRDNFRNGRADMAVVRSHALPAYQVAGFLAPDFAGSPVQHDYYDPSTAQRQPSRRHPPADPIDWGDRNAVEGAVYLGLLPLALIAIGGRPRRDALFMGLFALAALLLAFGTWLYAPYLRWMPLVSQLRTPVRWTIPASLALALLAGRALAQLAETPDAPRRCRRLGGVLLGLALAGLLAVLLTVVAPDRFISLAARVYAGAGRVRLALADPLEFLRFEAGIAWQAALWMGLTGAALLLHGRRPTPATRGLLVVVAALDLLHADLPFFTHAPPFRSLSTPAEIAFLREQPGLWRIATFGTAKVLPPNTATLYGLDDIRGYESVMRREYVRFLESIEPQPDIDFNIAGTLRRPASLASPWLDFLNVRYVLADAPIDAPGWRKAFEGQVTILENLECLPRYYLAAPASPACDQGPPPPLPDAHATLQRHDATAVDVATEAPVASWLVSSETDYGLWHATVDGREAASTPVLGFFRGVRVPPGRHLVRWRLR